MKKKPLNAAEDKDVSAVLFSSPLWSCRDGGAAADSSAVHPSFFIMTAHVEEKQLMTEHSLSVVRSHLTSCSCQSFHAVWMSEENSVCPDGGEASICPHSYSVCDDELLFSSLPSSESFDTAQVMEIYVWKDYIAVFVCFSSFRSTTWMTLPAFLFHTIQQHQANLKNITMNKHFILSVSILKLSD